MGSHLTQEQVDDLRGESRWPPAIVLCIAIAVPLLLPDRFSLVSKWIEPALLALLLVAHIIADPGRIDRQSSATRTIGVGLLAVLVVGATTQAVVLTVELVNGNRALNNPTRCSHPEHWFGWKRSSPSPLPTGRSMQAAQRRALIAPQNTPT
jgi:hypothetical protein